MRLDDAPETPKCYHNCEICVVRNVKGKRPEGYVAQPPEELAKLRKTDPKEALEERPASEKTALSEALERVFQTAEENAAPLREKKLPPERRGGSRRPERRRRPRNEEEEEYEQLTQRIPQERKKQQPPRHTDKPKGDKPPRTEKPKGPETEGEKTEKKQSGRNHRRRHRGGGGQPKPPAAE